METKVITNLSAKLVECNGTSAKTGKPFTLYKVVIDTGVFGEVEILLDTRKDKAGIVLETIAKHYV